MRPARKGQGQYLKKRTAGGAAPSTQAGLVQAERPIFPVNWSERRGSQGSGSSFIDHYGKEVQRKKREKFVGIRLCSLGSLSAKKYLNCGKVLEQGDFMLTSLRAKVIELRSSLSWSNPRTETLGHCSKEENVLSNSSHRKSREKSRDGVTGVYF